MSIKCYKCLEDKNETDFYKRKNGILRKECKKCSYEDRKRNKNSNREKYLENNKKYYYENCDKIKQRSADWYNKNKNKTEFIISKQNKDKEYRKNNSETLRQKWKIRYEKNKEKEKIRTAIWANKNKEKLNERNRINRKNNPEKIKQWYKKHTENNPQYRLKKSMAQHIRHSLILRNSSKERKQTFRDILPYSTLELKQHLESLLHDGMSWENYGAGPGKWHIDHKIPDSWFEYTSIEDEGFRKSWALENLKPMWGIDNIRKGNRYSD